LTRQLGFFFCLHIYSLCGDLGRFHFTRKP
jgi:hypothetical protein